MIPRPPLSTLFPYTTLFPSGRDVFGSRDWVGTTTPRHSRWGWQAEMQCVKYTLGRPAGRRRSEEHTSELQSHSDLVCRLLLEKKKKKKNNKEEKRNKR